LLRLDDIRKDTQLTGIEPGQAVRVVAADPVGADALIVVYRTVDGRLRERLLFRSDEAALDLTAPGCAWAFDAPAAEFKLAVEAYRINLAWLFDPMMAVHSSNIEPLPHQITAVYESMLPRQPLRYVLADDPGAGKTIMAGLLIRELSIRADARRVLVVAPGSLVEQWQDELYEKFGLEFALFSRDLQQQSRSGNPFDSQDFLIARLDQVSRDPDLLAKLESTHWDLTVVDEAHKLSASWAGAKLSETKRFKLGKLLGSISRHLLLMTATPHNGKEEDFQLFLSLLDSDRFYGKFRDGVHRVDVSDLMRRMVKEKMVRFDGTPLFPERIARTVTYRLSDIEAALYHAVTEYVREEMNRADRLDDAGRRGTVGFALTSLQRRLASSPEAIYQSLKRRCVRLQRRVQEEKLHQRGARLSETLTSSDLPEDVSEAADEMPDTEYEAFEEAVVDQATAAQTILELEAEIASLARLVEQAHVVAHSGEDRKWEELSRLLQSTAEMRDPDGRQRKLIVFTEHRDTLSYLTVRIRGLLGSEEAVVNIHGGVTREERKKTQELFRNDRGVRVLVATDAAGEGINLQNANLMVNYDLPWNPNRIEQRFGRIHRIGQTEVCHLWNMVAAETREGDVFQRLFAKIEAQRTALGGRVFDILGEVFDETPLRDLLIEAIRYGDDPAVRARLEQQVEGALDTVRLVAILQRNALCEESMTAERLFAVKEEMDRVEARRLQPFFVRSFFAQAFQSLGGELRPREAGRWEITHVPAAIRERDRQISGRSRGGTAPVLRRYERVCFEKQQVRMPFKPMAALLHPGHPLVQAVTDLVLEQHRATLAKGAVLLDPTDPGTIARAVFLIDHAVKDGTAPDTDRAVSRRLQFVSLTPDGQTANAGWAPHLDLALLAPDDLARVQDVQSADWLNHAAESQALAYASGNLAPEHLAEVKVRRERQVDATLQAVHERLFREINFWSERYLKLQEDVSAGKQPRVQLDNVRRTIDDLTARLEQRRRELDAMRHVVSAPPVIAGRALIIPAGLLAVRGSPSSSPASSDVADFANRAAVERIAMNAVMAAERARGNAVFDVSAAKCGWDITSRPPAKDGRVLPDRHIEVKGRAKGQTTITVTRNEILYALNQADKFRLAIVLVDGDTVDGPHYVRTPFKQEPDWAVSSVNLELSELLRDAQPAGGDR